ncbi:hypothetical protein ACP4OV_001525 [Aristida adscensionis]
MTFEMPSSSSPPQPPWVVLGRVALVQHDSVDDPGDLSVALAVQPRASTLTVPMSLHPRPDFDDTDRHPYVVAADDAAGGLLLHVSHWPFVGFDLDPDPPGSLLVARDFHPRGAHPVGAATRVPTRAQSGQPGISNIRNVGFVSRPGTAGAEYVVAELRLVGGGDDDDRATLHCFRSGTDAWVGRDLSCPSMHGDRGLWSSHDVVAHDGKLWWVNLVWGLLGCDPFADEPELRHVKIPPAFANGRKVQEWPTVECHRMVKVIQGKLRYVAMARDFVEPVEETLMFVKTLEFGPSGETRWEIQSCNSLGVIWASDSYIATGMPEEVPVLALVHPGNPDVVYFFLNQYLFGVNLVRSMVTEFVHEPCNLVEVVAGHKRPPPISWRYVLAWELPSSLADALENLMDEDEDGASPSEGCGSLFLTPTADLSDTAATPELNDTPILYLEDDATPEMAATPMPELIDTDTSTPDDDDTTIPDLNDTSTPDVDATAMPALNDRGSDIPDVDDTAIPELNDTDTAIPGVDGTTIPEPKDTDTAIPDVDDTAIPEPKDTDTAIPTVDDTTMPELNDTDTVIPNVDDTAMPEPKAADTTVPNVDDTTMPEPWDTDTAIPNVDDTSIPDRNDRDSTIPDLNDTIIPDLNDKNEDI